MTSSFDLAREVLVKAQRDGASIPSLAQIIVSMFEGYDIEPRRFYDYILRPIRSPAIDSATQLIAESTPIRFFP